MDVSTDISVAIIIKQKNVFDTGSKAQDFRGAAINSHETKIERKWLKIF